jgi:hypothetical protein
MRSPPSARLSLIGGGGTGDIGGPNPRGSPPGAYRVQRREQKPHLAVGVPPLRSLRLASARTAVKSPILGV